MSSTEPDTRPSFQVTVTQVEVYGLHCQTAQGRKGQILIPYLSWVPCFNSCHQFAIPGLQLEATIRDTGVASDSLALAHCEIFPNPWDEGLLVRGKTLTGVVFRRIVSADRCGNGPACLLMIRPGTYAMLCGDQPDLNPGDEIEVEIVKADQRTRQVQLRRRDVLNPPN